MKRLSALLFMAFLLNGCDDGDLITEDISFDNVSVQRCGPSSDNTDILYKLNGREVLILQIGNLETELPSVPTPENSPKLFTLNGTSIRALYRQYSGDAAANNICQAIQPPTPVVTEEWNALAGGTVQVTTTAMKVANNSEGFAGGETISSLRHAIVLKNITFQTPNNEIVYETYPFGNYDKPFTGPSLNIGSTLRLCEAGGPDGNDLLYKIIPQAALTINLEHGLLDTSVLNTPKTGLIDGTTNQVFFKRFASGTDLTALDNSQTTDVNEFCSAYNPDAAIETWTGQQGVTGVSGIVEVTTTTFGVGSFKHIIRLKNLYLQNAGGTLSYKVADDFLFGEIIVTP